MKDEDNKIKINDKITLTTSKESLREKAEESFLKKEGELFIYPKGTQSADDISSKKVQELIHELQVHQIELQMQNDELLIAQTKLKDSQKHYLDLYNMAPVGYFTLSEEGLILKANNTAAKLLGFNTHTLVKKQITDFILKEDQDIFYFYRKKFFELNQEVSCELRMLNQNGTQFWTHLSAVAETDLNEIPYIRLVMVDITENKKIQEEIQTLNNNLKNEITKQLEELRKKDRLLMEQANLAQMGEMLNMIAHQWRQPLNAMSASVINLSMKNELDMLNKESIEETSKFI